jgi:hypothetical protein
MELRTLANYSVSCFASLWNKMALILALSVVPSHHRCFRCCPGRCRPLYTLLLLSCRLFVVLTPLSSTAHTPPTLIPPPSPPLPMVMILPHTSSTPTPIPTPHPPARYLHLPGPTRHHPSRLLRRPSQLCLTPSRIPPLHPTETPLYESLSVLELRRTGVSV